MLLEVDEVDEIIAGVCPAEPLLLEFFRVLSRAT
jgi:hypothetical protein